MTKTVSAGALGLWPAVTGGHVGQRLPTDVFAFTMFPRGQWRKILSHNPRERRNKELRRNRVQNVSSSLC